MVLYEQDASALRVEIDSNDDDVTLVSALERLAIDMEVASIH